MKTSPTGRKPKSPRPHARKSEIRKKTVLCGEECLVIYCARRSVMLRCERDGTLTLRVPLGVWEDFLSRFLEEHRAWIDRHRAEIAKEEEKESVYTDEYVRALREKAKAILKGKVGYYANIMGVSYGRITVTGARGRFGSCSSSGNLSFSFRLMEYPEEAIDYVVVHELAHRKQMNHSPAFYAEVAKVLPDYKERSRLLKRR